MDYSFISIDHRDPLWIAVAFLFGLVFKQAKLPPMVGFLVAGFVLHWFGAEKDAFLLAIADMGVTLLLFSIGLKLRINTLARREIWASTGIHMGASVVLGFGVLMTFALTGMLLFDSLDVTSALIVAFALSFSSTVFAVKTLEDRGSMGSRYGQIAIGILVLQDIAAVVFLAFSASKMPTIWSLGLLALIPGRHLLGHILTHSGHKELLAIFGFVLALGGAALFEVVGLKGDLGALAFGVLLANHPRSNELAKTLLNFKDVFLVGFFLTIGLTGLPTWETVSAAVILLALIPFKILFFVYLFLRFRLRSRPALYGGLVLGNFSEFSLIVSAIAIQAGWLDPQWLTVIALSLSASFILSSPLNVNADAIYKRFLGRLLLWQSPRRLPGDENISLSNYRILIFGMGRVGRATYDVMAPQVDNQIIGIDQDEFQVKRNAEEGRNAVLGDATNLDFWSRLDHKGHQIEMILLATPNIDANIMAAQTLRSRDYKGPIVAIALFPEHEQLLKDNGIDEVFNIYAEAGSGAAARIMMHMDNPKAPI